MDSWIVVLEMLQVLEQTGLVPAEPLEAIRKQSEAGRCQPDELAALLIEQGWLTPFQADRLGHGTLMLGPYVLLECLGEGGMGEVYKARHRLLDRTVALKVIRRDYVQNAQAVRRFLREIKLAASLQHPHIVQVYDADQVHETLFYTMEFLPGTNLSTVVKTSGPLEPDTACEYVSQASEGLAHAHARGLVHRDIKPSNLMLLKDPETVKVLDLGLAFQPRGNEGGDPDALTGSLVALGTADYMAPEQALDSHKVDARADLYGLGCTLYYLLTGRPPFPGGNSSQKQLRHLREEPGDIDQLRPNLPEGLAAVLRKLMAKKPEDRYQSAQDVHAALLPFRSSSDRNSFSSAVTRPLSGHRGSRPRAWPAGLLAALAVALAATILVSALVLRPGKTTPAPSQLIVSRGQAPAANVFATIRAALDQAQPGDHILVRDEDHEECLEILHGERGRGVTVAAATPSGRPVTWRPPSGLAIGKPLLDLRQVEGFRLKGFVLDGLNQVEHLVAIQGACPGLQLEQVQLRGFTQAAVRLDGCVADPQQPLRLLELTAKASRETASALVLTGSPCQDVEIRGCLFVGPFASIIRLAAPLRRVRVVHNRFFKAADALLFQSTAIDPRYPVELTVASNTFHSIQTGLHVGPLDLVEKSSKLEMTNNLFAGTAALARADGGHPATAQKGLWVVPPADLPPGGPRYFRMTWDKLPRAPKRALLELDCDDRFQAWCNNVLIQEAEPGQRHYAIDCTRAITESKDSMDGVAIQCFNRDGRAGLRCQISFDFGKGLEPPHRWSEVHVEVSHTARDDWRKPVSIDNSFQNSVTATVGPLPITGSIGNVRDGSSAEGNLVLNASPQHFTFLSLDPLDPVVFLRYAAGSPLLHAGFQGQPAGVPPAEKK